MTARLPYSEALNRASRTSKYIEILFPSVYSLDGFGPLAIFSFVCISALLVHLRSRFRHYKECQRTKTSLLPSSARESQEDEVKPWKGENPFDIDPIKYRPYKNQGHVTMGW